MRNLILLMIAVAIFAGLLACNSNETLLSRRISVEELHKLWEKNDVLVIDTRPEPAYKQEHIKGSISVPAGTLAQKYEELPRDKMIVAYCT